MAGGGRLSGGCQCGSVKVSLDSSVETVAQFWCHCYDCRFFFKLPICPLIIWKEALGSTFKIEQGEDKLSKTILHENGPNVRYFCRECGDSVYNFVQGGKFISARANTVTDFPFKPTFHQFYEEKVMQLHDGLPKYSDRPGFRGGSDKKMSETGQPSD